MKAVYLVLAIIDVVVSVLPPYDLMNFGLLAMGGLMYYAYTQEK